MDWIGFGGLLPNEQTAAAAGALAAGGLVMFLYGLFGFSPARPPKKKRRKKKRGRR